MGEQQSARSRQRASDRDWDCPRPLDWQRHYRILADLAADDPHGSLPDIQPGVLFEGNDPTGIQRPANSWP
ncbi:hypothetical protein [Streptomyces sp. NPDC101165]|uniref:hypothetical protein n=1 Tax=Streptomyces sp. NPDC101165 TaxID=3366119 RepID=UPI003824FA79